MKAYHPSWHMSRQMIVASVPHMPTKIIAEMHGVSHKWLKKWLKQNYPDVKRRMYKNEKDKAST